MEIRRFGIGHRRPDGPPGTTGVHGQPIHNDPRGYVGELALGRHARIEPHTNPNTTYFVVIEGGGFVQVGDERARVAAGEAVLWPANVLHAAWTELSEMRAIVVEFAAADDASQRLLIEGVAVEAPAAIEALPRGGRGEGRLAAKPATRIRHARSPEGEPW